jgi:hypothetical protein
MSVGMVNCPAGVGDKEHERGAFDLLACLQDEGLVEEIQEGELFGQTQDGASSREILEATENRLNKDPLDAHCLKSGSRGMIRFAVPLKKVLLCNPSSRPWASIAKKQAPAEGSATNKPDKKKGVKASCVLSTLDDQATMLLMMTCGILGEGEQLN